MYKFRVPDGWMDYEAIGKRIPGTRFVAFKTPLKEGICRNLSSANHWLTPDILIRKLSEKNMKLGLLVDFTNTRRYYDSRDFERRGIQYEKIFTEGHSVPNSEVIKRFFTVVDKFYTRNKDNDLLVGVHCTHGVNRTGYFVCRYMVDKLNFEAVEALRRFGDGRGYPVERENYISDLKEQSMLCHSLDKLSLGSGGAAGARTVVSKKNKSTDDYGTGDDAANGSSAAGSGK